VLLVVERRRGQRLDALVIETSAAAFFAALMAVSIAWPDTALRDYASALSLGWLALTAWGSLAIRRPFTLGIARTTTPREAWVSPVFRRVNMVITVVWAAGFTVAAAGLAVLDAVAPRATVLAVAINACGIAAPAVFTARYPRTVAARLRATLPASAGRPFRNAHRTAPQK
jgi:hypothetical protein